ncbi:hypothetical protein A5789_09190 [Nocardia sp. 852002-51101_SCH5132738]|uniref:hypothetical protein n=1 Tax=Nocardia sp. 852002-51101_SCH5132738 TaxID=1834095 RepID=UPI0007EA5EBA|nr:hypothetical protein [Nocardia sp. 852002-51101_SCH5132738]OBA44455.1 hypothetical protein A5789_09190 [Nocardia sp. 852002-51101_SCH5132738]
MITTFDASEELLTELKLEDSATDSQLDDAIVARHTSDNHVIDSIYHGSHDTIKSLVSFAEESGWGTSTPELAPLCEATGCQACDEHWRTTIWGSETLLGFEEIRDDLKAIYAALGLTLTAK